eukprot:COSAG06_NODE_5171_length_3663_cov_5.372334_1_plen_185_part_00
MPLIRNDQTQEIPGATLPPLCSCFHLPQNGPFLGFMTISIGEAIGEVEGFIRFCDRRPLVNVFSVSMCFRGGGLDEFMRGMVFPSFTSNFSRRSTNTRSHPLTAHCVLGDCKLVAKMEHTSPSPRGHRMDSMTIMASTRQSAPPLMVRCDWPPFCHHGIHTPGAILRSRMTKPRKSRGNTPDPG